MRTGERQLRLSSGGITRARAAGVTATSSTVEEKTEKSRETNGKHVRVGKRKR